MMRILKDDNTFDTWATGACQQTQVFHFLCFLWNTKFVGNKASTRQRNLLFSQQTTSSPAVDLNMAFRGRLNLGNLLEWLTDTCRAARRIQL